MVSHTMSDLLALPAEDRMKAKGFVERSGMVICGGLPRSEMDQLTCTRIQHHEHGALEPLPWITPPSELYDPLTLAPDTARWGCFVTNWQERELMSREWLGEQPTGSRQMRALATIRRTQVREVAQRPLGFP
jgi:hypothetical protein